MVALGWELGSWGKWVNANEYRVSIWGQENVLKLNVVIFNTCAFAYIANISSKRPFIWTRIKALFGRILTTKPCEEIVSKELSRRERKMRKNLCFSTAQTAGLEFSMREYKWSSRTMILNSPTDATVNAYQSHYCLVRVIKTKCLTHID